jgi:hypothetical protein
MVVENPLLCCSPFLFVFLALLLTSLVISMAISWVFLAMGWKHGKLDCKCCLQHKWKVGMFWYIEL